MIIQILEVVYLILLIDPSKEDALVGHRIIDYQYYAICPGIQATQVLLVPMYQTCNDNYDVTYFRCWHGSLQVDAAIVRIMKTRKVLSHTLLITELFRQVTTLPFGYLIQVGSVNSPLVPCQNNGSWVCYTVIID